jgi:hypothetical protein
LIVAFQTCRGKAETLLRIAIDAGRGVRVFSSFVARPCFGEPQHRLTTFNLGLTARRVGTRRAKVDLFALANSPSESADAQEVRQNPVGESISFGHFSIMGPDGRHCQIKV